MNSPSSLTQTAPYFPAGTSCRPSVEKSSGLPGTVFPEKEMGRQCAFARSVKAARLTDGGKATARLLSVTAAIIQAVFSGKAGRNESDMGLSCANAKLEA